MNVETVFLCLSVALAVAILVTIACPPLGADRSTVIGAWQSLVTIYAVAAALMIAFNDRRVQSRLALDERVAERQAFARRRDYEEAAKLLQFVEADLKVLRANPNDQPRSEGAAALILATWAKRNWWGMAVDYYIQSLRDPKNRFASPRLATVADLERMRNDIIDAVLRLDFEERKPEDR